MTEKIVDWDFKPQHKQTNKEKMFCLEHLIKMNLSHTRKNAMLSPLTMTNVEVNDEGSLHSSSTGMQDMKNLQTKCEWIAST